MAAQIFELTFDGYWREANKEAVPAKSGIYCVYECTHNIAQKTITLHQLIFIGESDNANKSISKIEKLNSWRQHVRQGNQLCFSFAPVENENRERIEAALIFKHKPIEDYAFIDSFPFDETTIVSRGTASLLNTNFTVERTENYKATA